MSVDTEILTLPNKPWSLITKNLNAPKFCKNTVHGPLNYMYMRKKNLKVVNFFFFIRPHKVNSVLLVPRTRRFWCKIKKKKKKKVGVLLIDQTATGTAGMDEGKST